MLCRVPFGELTSAEGEAVLSLGGIFLWHTCPLPPGAASSNTERCPFLSASEEERDAEEASAEILKMSTGRSTTRLWPRLHEFLQSRHPSWFVSLWRAPSSPDLLRQTCTSADGCAVWKALLLNADDVDPVPLLCACLADVTLWMADEHASQFLICALLHAHPAASDALARAACRSLRDGDADTTLACARRVILTLAQAGFPMIVHAVRMSPTETVAPLLLEAESYAFLSAIAQIPHSEELVEFLQLWHPAQWSRHATLT